MTSVMTGTGTFAPTVPTFTFEFHPQPESLKVSLDVLLRYSYNFLRLVGKAMF